MRALVVAACVLVMGCTSEVSLGRQSDGTADATIDTHPVDAAPAADGPHYEPCAGKACGVACTVCDPHDTQCVEPPGSKQCNAHQQCVTVPVCP